MSIPRVVLPLLKVTWVAVMAVGTAPGDEEDLCADLRAGGTITKPVYSPTMGILMDRLLELSELASPSYGSCVDPGG